MDDIKKIFKDQGMEAVAAFNWTDLVSNEVAFCILEEIKNQLKERNEPKKQLTSASIVQPPFYIQRIENNRGKTIQNDG